MEVAVESHESLPTLPRGRVEAESVPTHEELVARAHALGPRLRERSAAACAARQLPRETIADFIEAGFFRILQPKAWGGYEHKPQVFFDVQMTIGSYCPSSAWVLGVVGVHQWQLALFDVRAQEEVWGRDNRVLISSSYMPVGKVTRVEGGYRLSGRWGFSSGSEHCDWAFLGAFVPGLDGKPPDMRTFLVPKGDYRIEDTWHVSGLKATGSNDVVIDDCFVPEYRTHRFADGFTRRNPGQVLNTGTLFRIPFGQLFVRSVSTTSIGILAGAIASFKEVAMKRVSRADGQRTVEDTHAQVALARASSTLDELKLVLRRNMDVLWEAAEADRDLPMEQRVAFRLDSSMVVDKTLPAIDALFTAMGGSAIFVSNPINGFFQDIHTARAHYANNPDKPARNLGGVMLEQKTTDYFL
jgi:3-hydroxy-9,10-secoandrosta-1,3,5(10)-triene-9,17-dione monooxygenase